jgi:hypothetical protein
VYTYGSAMDRQYMDKVKLPHPAQGTLFYHNWYYGSWLNGLPDDPEKTEGDPLFVAPGTGGPGLETLIGYKLRPESPAINKGMLIAANGGRDFFGNPLNDGSPDFGAFEQIGSGAVPDTMAENKLNRYEKAVSLFAWTKRKFPDMVAIPAEGGNVSTVMNVLLQGSMASATRLDTVGKSPLKSGLRWTSADWNIQPKAGDFTKANNNNLSFKIMPNKKDPSLPLLFATLQVGDQKDEWSIPVYLSQKVEMGNLQGANPDGDMAKWKNLQPLSVNSSNQVFQLRDKWQGPQDGSCSMKAAISGDNLLLFVEVTDKDFSNDALVPSQNDGVEICFDTRANVVPGVRTGGAPAPGGGTNPPAAPGGRASSPTPGQIILLAQEKDGTVEKAYWLQRRNNIPLPAEVKTFFRRTTSGYIMELSVPFTLIGMKTIPVKGESISLEVVLNNRVGKGESAYIIRMCGAGYPNYLSNSRAYSRFVIK